MSQLWWSFADKLWPGLGGWFDQRAFGTEQRPSELQVFKKRFMTFGTEMRWARNDII